MTSTYSPYLRLELMATGDQSGTWGTTTNTNLGTLLEQAICGVLSVAEGDTTLTLTANNGATDQARNMVLDFTGAMTAAHNVIVPTSPKIYLAKNSTTGGYAITVKTSGGTGVSIAAGTSQWVYCDGTNVVQGLVSSAGTLAVSGGGTGLTSGTSGGILGFTATGTLASSIALTASALVLGGGAGATPTPMASLGTTTTVLHGNAAGAPTFGAVNLAADVSGTLPIARGGTGSTTGAFTIVRTQVFTSSGTYTPNANMLYCIIECVGGGGGGGGTSGGTTQVNNAGGGGAGAYSCSVKTITDIGASKAVTIGAAGAAGSTGSNAGGSGGTSSVGSLVTAPGGVGAAGGGSSGGTGGAGGAAGTANVAAPGGSGQSSGGTPFAGTPIMPSGNGANSQFGSGGIGQRASGNAVNGSAGTGYGSGGGGGTSNGVVTTASGGAGTAGLVVITEYCSA